MRLLHTADWQIGTQFGQFSAEEAAHLTEARYETVRRIASLAVERKVDELLVADDVFDQQTVSDTVIRTLFAALAAYCIRDRGSCCPAITTPRWRKACGRAPCV